MDYSKSNRFQRIISLLFSGNLAQLRYKLWARWKGLDFGYAPCGCKGGNDHAHSGGPELESVLSALHVPADKSCVDVGSGKGLAAFTLAHHFKSVLGVESENAMVEIAGRNAARLAVHNTRFVCCDATTLPADVRGGCDWFYMFNPFVTEVMDRFLASLEESIRSRPRKVTIIYKHPACHATVLQHGFKERARYQFKNSHDFVVYESL